MDPDECLKKIRRLTKEYNDGLIDDFEFSAAAELVAALDEWICNGGFLPKAWTNVVSAQDIADLEETT